MAGAAGRRTAAGRPEAAGGGQGRSRAGRTVHSGAILGKGSPRPSEQEATEEGAGREEKVSGTSGSTHIWGLTRGLEAREATRKGTKNPREARPASSQRRRRPPRDTQRTARKEKPWLWGLEVAQHDGLAGRMRVCTADTAVKGACGPGGQGSGSSVSGKGKREHTRLLEGDEPRQRIQCHMQRQ